MRLLASCKIFSVFWLVVTNFSNIFPIRIVAITWHINLWKYVFCFVTMMSPLTISNLNFYYCSQGGKYTLIWIFLFVFLLQGVFNTSLHYYKLVYYCICIIILLLNFCVNWKVMLLINELSINRRNLKKTVFLQTGIKPRISRLFHFKLQRFIHTIHL